MTNVNKTKLEKYVPVRKQLKVLNASKVCQKQSLTGSQAGEKTTLPKAA